MSVYVDTARYPLGRMRMCHMIADTTEELLAMADRIGVARRHLQDAGTYKEHFDVCLYKRDLAMVYGAREVSCRELALKLVARKGQHDPRQDNAHE